MRVGTVMADVDLAATADVVHLGDRDGSQFWGNVRL